MCRNIQWEAWHMTKKNTNAAYQTLRELGMRPAIARHFLVKLRESGFVIAEEKSIVSAQKINRKIEVIISLMRQGNRRRK